MSLWSICLYPKAKDGRQEGTGVYMMGNWWRMYSCVEATESDAEQISSTINGKYDHTVHLDKG
jgi:hypothetical protein